MPVRLITEIEEILNHIYTERENAFIKNEIKRKLTTEQQHKFYNTFKEVLLDEMQFVLQIVQNDIPLVNVDWEVSI